MYNIDQMNKRPIFKQIEDQTLSMIAKGELSAGENLPSVRKLSASLGINPNTIQKAYKNLESSGAIYTVKGKGSFISSPAYTSFSVHKIKCREIADVVREALELNVPKNSIVDVIGEVFKEHESQRLKGGQK